MTTPPRWIRAALRVLPRAFRDRFGADVSDTIASLADDARRAGGPHRKAAYVAREMAALARLALGLRWRSGTLADDVRWAVRYARGRPMLTLAVTVTLAVTIAAATTAFGLASAVLWRPLPFHDADRIVFFWEEVARDGGVFPNRFTCFRHAAWRDTIS